MTALLLATLCLLAPDDPPKAAAWWGPEVDASLNRARIVAPRGKSCSAPRPPIAARAWPT